MSVELHHRLDGPEDAPVLMLSNSLGTALGMWDDLLPGLAEHFRVLRYDQRGHGRSPAPPGPYTVAELASDALELLDRLGLERVSFCGVSLGGMTGMWLAINAPERIDRLGLCCTSAHLPPREMWTERAATVRAQGMEAVADAAMERWFTPAFAGREARGVRAHAPDAARHAAPRATPPRARRSPHTTSARSSARSARRRSWSPPATIRPRRRSMAGGSPRRWTVPGS